MVSPSKRSSHPAHAFEPDYTPVPTNRNSAGAASPPPTDNDPYANLSGNLPEGAYLSPVTDDTALLGRRGSDVFPAPSIISRDSTHASLPGTPGADNRQSWGSGTALAAAAEGIAGAPQGSRLRTQSHLGASPIGWRDASDEEDDEQGHITPAVAGIGATEMSEKPRWAADETETPRKSRKWLWIGLGAGAIMLLAGLGVGLGIGLTRNKNKAAAGNSNNNAVDNGSNTSHSGSGSHTGTATGSAATPTATSGGQGSILTFEDGSTMKYENSFGGTWVSDPSNPFNNDAKANSWTPALSQNWTWGVDKVYGVNLGGWFVTEPFIVSSLYEIYSTGPGGTAVDEYTLSLNMGANLTTAMTEHYSTFITEKDIAEIATAGLNWVRIPVGHWMVATITGEPYLERVSWTYFLKAVQWCRKYGIRINLDLHTVPGSQNGWNHSGKLGTINWMNGAMGLANAQRALDVIRTLAEFVSQPEYAPVVPLFGFINEPNGLNLNKQVVGTFYNEAYKVIREVTGIGAGNGPMLSMHDGFLGTTTWAGFLPGMDRMALDQHPYMAFQDQQVGSMASIQTIPCQWWASGTNTSSSAFGVTVSGEWSVAINDCGHWVNSVGSGSRYDGTMAGYSGPNKGAGSCDFWNDYTQWDAATKAGLMHVARGSMDALQNYFFWTWKIGNSTTQAQPQVNPFWHYRLGWKNGFIPTDPRTAVGTCQADGVSGPEFDGEYPEPYMTGGAGAGTIAPAASSAYAWPPISFTGVPAASMSLLAQYTQTGTPITMPAPTYTSPSGDSINAGSGWFNANDNRQAFMPIANCAYPAEYSAASLMPTAGSCGAGKTQLMKKSPVPAPTAPPS